ncbi:MAG: vitamin K epoxide reductase family protein [Candidatus Bipolaricaulota bacterium]|nr:vitamin K epoxide reductase family protein [Candidatus Bipolaricaulota bacterium]MCS7273838.1 vitamin K epoxide reductase family protein [Candidatus Bipolaricaulota bacterium]MDW8110744.1 vitamin K epoxide reductase family protein [Candidatus Bipolaricaulota bacterium]MDW8328398.1 vitamin K epoxide reductase family protein [Candidatus Bipolaricaulota bacterium]
MKWRLWVILCLALAGVGVSGYLTYSKLTNTELLCLGEGNPCEVVQTSIYAYIGPIPVALLGLGGYLLFVLVTALQLKASGERRKTLAGLNFGLALGAFLYSLYLSYLQRFVIGAFCLWCVVSALIVTLIFVLSVWELRVLTASCSAPDASDA